MLASSSSSTESVCTSTIGTCVTSRPAVSQKKPPKPRQTAAKAPVKNEDLWRRLDEARLRHEVDWRWVKGHAGHELNERADALARRGLEEFGRAR